KLIGAAAVVCLLIVIAFLIISLPYFFQGYEPWLAGFRAFLQLSQAGEPAFLLGEYSYRGWWNYFIVAFLLKTPIGTLVLIIASLVLLRTGNRLGYDEALCLLVPVAIF